MTDEHGRKNVAVDVAPIDRQLVLSLLREAFGRSVSILSDTALGRGNVWRLALAGVPQPWVSIIAKRVGRDPGGFLDEVAALRTLPTGVAPRLLSVSLDPPMILMEDVRAATLAELLLASDPAAANAATDSLAATLARMHSEMLGRVAQYRELRRALGAPRRRRLHHRPSATSSLRQRLLEAGLEEPMGLAADVALVDRIIEDPGPFRTYIHGDPCPDNVLVADDPRLIDFEWGGVGHALLDACYLEVPFPTCWCYGNLPEPLVRSFEATYRTRLSTACPAAEDDETWHVNLAAASASWWLAGIDEFLAPAFDQDGQWGTATLRQRVIHRTERFARLAERTQSLHALGSAADSLIRRWRVRWPELADVEWYPALRAPH